MGIILLFIIEIKFKMASDVTEAVEIGGIKFSTDGGLVCTRCNRKAVKGPFCQSHWDYFNICRKCLQIGNGVHVGLATCGSLCDKHFAEEYPFNMCVICKKSPRQTGVEFCVKCESNYRYSRLYEFPYFDEMRLAKFKKNVENH